MKLDAKAFLSGLFADHAAVELAAGSIHNPADLPAEWREEWADRAAIREYEGGQAREHAEAEALAEIVARMRETREAI